MERSTIRTVAPPTRIMAAPPEHFADRVRRLAERLSGAGHHPAEIADSFNARGIPNVGRCWCADDVVALLEL